MNAIDFTTNDTATAAFQYLTPKRKAKPHSAVHCPGCGSGNTEVFYRAQNVPVHDMLLMPTRQAAVDYPRGDVALAYCRACGFIFNQAFQPELLEYCERYEETQGFSETFNRFAKKLVWQLIEKYALRGKRILEIGCGKGEFLTMLCEIGGNSGIGYDPAYIPGREKSAGQADVRFVRDFYTGENADQQADFICCRMTLEHIPNVAEFVSMVRRSMHDPNARVMFQVPDVTRILQKRAFWDIFYEHCSYFSHDSLRNLFINCGFDICDLWSDFNDQYLLLVAQPHVGNGRHHEAPDLTELTRAVTGFRVDIKSNIENWMEVVQNKHRQGRRIVLWGSGSKAVAFLNTLDLSDEIDFVVDINPYRQESYMAGTGQKIVSPEFLAAYKPDDVIVMNPIYLDEIRRQLHELRLSPEVMPVETERQTDSGMMVRPANGRLAGANGVAHRQTAVRRRCRFCDADLNHVFVDLGMSPPCQSFRTPEQLDQYETFYPLVVYICDNCFLAQLDELITPQEIFSEYAYFSSYSDSWLAHAKAYANKVVEQFAIDTNSKVVEIASNDGYLLQYFVAKGIPALGVEPAANVAEAARQKGVPTQVAFFNEALAKQLVAEGWQADLLIGNNVLSQVPSLNDFIRGMKILLKPGGVLSLEFQHLLRLMQGNQFDTIYHEHFSYFSFITVEKLLTAHGFSVFDLEELPTHGGSLRVYAAHADDKSRMTNPSVQRMKAEELATGMTDLNFYFNFTADVETSKHGLLNFLHQAKRQGKAVAAYGAPGKGSTLLNYCGVGMDLVTYCVDRNPYKQGRFLPGAHIPIYHPDKIRETRPDYVLILPWNLRDEIMHQLNYIRSWGGKFVIPIPEVQVLDGGQRP